jgi:hypothetical protein
MIRTSVLLAVLLFPFTPAAFAGAPEINVEAVCKARSALQPPFPDQDCARDEEAAKRQLGTLWESTSASIRKRCESDARSLGTMSYLDLTACIEITEDSKPGSQDKP